MTVPPTSPHGSGAQSSPSDGDLVVALLNGNADIFPHTAEIEYYPDGELRIIDGNTLIVLQEYPDGEWVWYWRYEKRFDDERLRTLIRNRQEDPTVTAFYRKKPVIVEALLYRDERDKRAVRDFVTTPIDEIGTAAYPGLSLRTLEGWMHVSNGDWIVKGTEGEFYPVKPEAFAATFEPVNSLRVVTA